MSIGKKVVTWDELRTELRRLRLGVSSSSRTGGASAGTSTGDSDIPDLTAGDILYANAAPELATLAAAAAGQVLTSGTAPSWSDSPTLDDLTISNPVNIYALSHDSFADYDGDEHVAHSGVTLTAGTGLTGGGDISANRTFNVDVGIADDDIVQIDSASVVDNDYAKFTASGLEGRSYSEVLADLSGQAGSAFDWNSQNLTGIANAYVNNGGAVGVSGDARIEFDSTNHYLEVLGGDFFTDRWLSSATNTGFGVGVFGTGNLEHNAGNEGWYNTAYGAYALYANSTGYRNQASGYQALRFNSTGYSNTASGYVALRYNTTGYRNTASGYAALYSNTTGYGNTASGYYALFSVNPTAAGEGIGNIGIGYQAGDNITTGSYNLIIGYDIDAKSATANYQLSIADVYRGHINDGEAYIACPSTICGDADLANSEVSFAVDEVNHELDIKVKYSDGTVKSGTVALA